MLSQLSFEALAIRPGPSPPGPLLGNALAMEAGEPAQCRICLESDGHRKSGALRPDEQYIPRLVRTFTAFKRGHANSPFTSFKRRSNDVQTTFKRGFRGTFGRLAPNVWL
jgi:hypothetical protein